MNYPKPQTLKDLPGQLKTPVYSFVPEYTGMKFNLTLPKENHFFNNVDWFGEDELEEQNTSWWQRKNFKRKIAFIFIAIVAAMLIPMVVKIMRNNRR